VEEFLTHPDTALLLGKAVAPEALQDDTVGRVLARLYAVGTMQVFTACAVRAARVFGFDKRYVHVDTTSITVHGDDLSPQEPEASEVPVRITDGDSQAKRPDRKPFVCSTRCVDRAVPRWGKPEEGKAADTTVQNTVRSGIATFLAIPGVAPGASISVADAALVTADNLAALGDTRCITRFPATYHECRRLSAEAVAHNTWAEVGGLAHTKPTKHRPVTSSQASEGEVRLEGTPDRAVVVHSSAQAKRPQPRRERALPAAQRTLQTAARTAAQPEYFGRADAAAAAAERRAMPTADHFIDVAVEERPRSGRGRPSSDKPRPVQARRYLLQTTLRPDTERISRRADEAGGFVRLTHVPPTGPLAHRARDILTVDNEHQGTEPNDGFLKAPVLVNRLFVKKPERRDA
jgi:hypothetical protein